MGAQINPFDESIVDNFAGGGGASTEIELGNGRIVNIAINHDPDAIFVCRKRRKKGMEQSRLIMRALLGDHEAAKRLTDAAVGIQAHTRPKKKPASPGTPAHLF